MFVRKPQWRRTNRRSKFREVRRQSIRKSFESETCNFESNASFNRKPMKFAKSRSDVMIPANRRKDYPCQGILDKLKAVKWRFRKAKEKRIAVVESWRDKGVGKNSSRVSIKRITHLTKKSFFKLYCHMTNNCDIGCCTLLYIWSTCIGLTYICLPRSSSI